jgi:hypothetical protein
MATRSFIGIQNDDGTIDGIYCHWDGGPGWNGKVLVEHYATAPRVRELLSGGSLSSLMPAIDPPDGVAHSFAEPADGVCVYYRRDRGDDCEEGPSRFPGGSEYMIAALNAHAEYAYLFDPAFGWRYVRFWRRPGRDTLPEWIDLANIVRLNYAT